MTLKIINPANKRIKLNINWDVGKKVIHKQGSVMVQQETKIQAENLKNSSSLQHYDTGSIDHVKDEQNPQVSIERVNKI